MDEVGRFSVDSMPAVVVFWGVCTSGIVNAAVLGGALLIPAITMSLVPRGGSCICSGDGTARPVMRLEMLALDGGP